jgi:N-methylhydantoinase B
MTVYFFGDGGTFPAKGVLGGKAGTGCGTWKRYRNGKLERQPDFDHCSASEKEAVHYRSCAGGGYGDPLTRDPRRVLADVNRNWLSPEVARKMFGVAVRLGPNGVDHLLDEDGTRRLRSRGAKSRAAKPAAKNGNGRRSRSAARKTGRKS